MTAVVHRRPRPATPARRRTAVAVAAGLNGLSAVAGVVGLVGGGLSFGEETDAGLPFESLPLAGVALAVFVAVPSLLLATAAWRGDRRTDALAIVLGICLLGWIVLQLAYIRALSPFQPIYAAIGIAFAASGHRHGGSLADLLGER